MGQRIHAVGMVLECLFLAISRPPERYAKVSALPLTADISAGSHGVVSAPKCFGQISLFRLGSFDGHRKGMPGGQIFTERGTK